MIALGSAVHSEDYFASPFNLKLLGLADMTLEEISVYLREHQA